MEAGLSNAVNMLNQTASKKNSRGEVVKKPLVFVYIGIGLIILLSLILIIYIIRKIKRLF